MFGELLSMKPPDECRCLKIRLFFTDVKCKPLFSLSLKCLCSSQLHYIRLNKITLSAVAMENKIESNSRSNFISFARNPVKQKPSHYHSWHGLRTPNEAFFIKIQNFWAWADKLGHLGCFRPNYQHPFWYSESLVHGFFHYATIISTINLSLDH